MDKHNAYDWGVYDRERGNSPDTPTCGEIPEDCMEEYMRGWNDANYEMQVFMTM